MIKWAIDKIFGTSSERYLKQYAYLALGKINALESEKENLSDEDLKLQTEKFFLKREKGATLDEILPDAFATVREASKRVLNMRPFDIQLIGGFVLHNGKIAEMKTGEGKTLVATLPAYLNALDKQGVHIITVNDYLAKRDRFWMGRIFEFLGLEVGFVQNNSSQEERRIAYAKDITYVTNNEIGFDYLRDNMVMDKQLRVVRGRHYAIIDEVDSILIDEARTPLIISGPTEDLSKKYLKMKELIPQLKGRIITEKEEIKSKFSKEDLELGNDFIAEEKSHSVTLTAEGIKKCEQLLSVFNLYDDVSGELVHFIHQSLRAKYLYKPNVDYVVKDGQVVIVDEFTGRLMPGRRWADGLHQSIEVKEGLKLDCESQTLASITFQNYFRLYKKLSGMTGTAFTEANEFRTIYKLEVVQLPTNKNMIRVDHADVIFKTEKDKYRAICEKTKELILKKRPILIGTRSVEKSEKISEMLKSFGIVHQVLNAKYHENEGEIIAQAGKHSAVTVATNMAGRGTDIVVGGNPSNEEVAKMILDNGGLFVLGSERHESRRIDNQLRGRTGRQGDCGETQFYLSLEDDLIRLFGGDKLSNFFDSGLMQKMGGWEEGDCIQSGILTKQVESAQKKVESMNFDIRKQLFEFDSIMNKQRSIVYHIRDNVLNKTDISQKIRSMIDEMIDSKLNALVFDEIDSKQESIVQIIHWMQDKFLITVGQDIFDGHVREYAGRLQPLAQKQYDDKKIEFGEESICDIERRLLLSIIDNAWKDHLYTLDHLKEGITLRSYAQKDPKIEYQRESFVCFDHMMDRIRDMMVTYLFHIQKPQVQTRSNARVPFQANESSVQSQILSKKRANNRDIYPINDKKKIGRNDLCICGSQIKYKKCCGK